MAGSSTVSAAAACEFLRANERYYDSLVQHLLTVDPDTQPEPVLRCIQLAAVFATNHHCGRFADGAIENLALSIGQRLEAIRPRAGKWAGYQPPALPADSRREILSMA